MPKRIVSAAVTGGIHTPTMSPHLPVTPKEIADDAIAAHKAGAAVVHIHARDPQTGKPCADMNVYGEIFDRIRSVCDPVLCATTGGGLGMPVSERVKVVPTHKPELASFNAGSVNFGLFDIPDRMNVTEWKHDWEKDYLYGTKDLIYTNTFKSMEEFAVAFSESGTKPEVEIFDSGMINNLAYLVGKGLIAKPVYLQFVLGILGGIPATIENLMFLAQTAERAFGKDMQWSVCAAGRHQMAMCTAGLLMGSHVRVGLEDSLLIERGVLAKSSAEQVEKIIRIMRELNFDPATPNEAREMLSLPVHG
jgi:uncharacterized protein (DUF849 family)